MGGKFDNTEWRSGKWLLDLDEAKEFIIGSTGFVSLIRLVDAFFVVNDGPKLHRRGWVHYLKHITCFEYGFLNFAGVWFLQVILVFPEP